MPGTISTINTCSRYSFSPTRLLTGDISRSAKVQLACGLSGIVETIASRRSRGSECRARSSPAGRAHRGAHGRSITTGCHRGSGRSTAGSRLSYRGGFSHHLYRGLSRRLDESFCARFGDSLSPSRVWRGQRSRSCEASGNERTDRHCEGQVLAANPKLNGADEWVQMGLRRVLLYISCLYLTISQSKLAVLPHTAVLHSHERVANRQVPGKITCRMMESM